MGKYSMNVANITTDASLDTEMALQAATGEQGEVIELICTGAGATAPADIQHRLSGGMLDFAGAGAGSSAQVPEAFDFRSNVALLGGTVGYTSEPTTFNAVSLVIFGFNQRGGMRWAVPRYEGVVVRGDDTEDGFGVRILSSSAGTFDLTMHHFEP